MEELKYFFSYSRKDSEFVLQLAQKLRAAGANVWLDRLDILGGEHWDETIQKTLKGCKGVIAVLSPESVASSNVMDEVSYALDEGKLVVPILIRSCEIPLRLRRLQYIDFAADYDTGFKRLLKDLGIEQQPDVEVKSRAVYTITASAGTGGAISPSGEMTVDSGADQSFAITPEAGYQIADVVVDGVSVGAVNSRDFANVTANHTIDASFAIKTYSLTAPAVHGSVTKNPDQASYKHGETVTLEAIPNEGYGFKNWSGDLSGSTNPATLVMDADKVVTAGFAVNVLDHREPTGVKTKKTWSMRQKTKVLAAIFVVALIAIMLIVVLRKILPPYGLYIPDAVGGFVTKDPNKPNYNRGETVILEALPNEGYSFTSWSEGLSGNTNPATLVMDSDKAVTAHFAVTAYTITASGGTGGSISPSGAVTVNSGSDQCFTITADTGHSVSDVLVDGSSLGAVPSHRFTNVTADHTIDASFVALKAGHVETNSIGMKLVYIPDGSFRMGSSDSAKQLAEKYHSHDSLFKDEIPQHQVRISKGFWMGQTEVTQGQYKLVMDDQPWSGKKYVQEDANNPAVFVTWDAAVEFCKKLSQLEGKTYRLPTEAEWEYACRAGTTTPFSFGDSYSLLDDYAWYRSNTLEVDQEYAHPVGEKNPNPWDLHDMHGNVWEWCSDWYDEDYYSNSPSVDPNGPSSGSWHSLRGGSWGSLVYILRCSVRFWGSRDLRLYVVGFRVVRSQS